MKLPKRIILASVALMMAFGPTMGQSLMSMAPTQAPNEVANVRFYVKRSNVRVVNAAKQTMQVFGIAGTCLATHHIDSDDKTFNLNLPEGIYILKIGDVTRKISLR